MHEHTLWDVLSATSAIEMAIIVTLLGVGYQFGRFLELLGKIAYLKLRNRAEAPNATPK